MENTSVRHSAQGRAPERHLFPSHGGAACRLQPSAARLYPKIVTSAELPSWANGTVLESRGLGSTSDCSPYWPCEHG
jgi:hypothetical protein